MGKQQIVLQVRFDSSTDLVSSLVASRRTTLSGKARRMKIHQYQWIMELNQQSSSKIISQIPNKKLESTYLNKLFWEIDAQIRACWSKVIGCTN